MIEYIQRVWVLQIIVFSLNFFTAEKYLTQTVPKLSQQKGFLISKSESKDMLFWKICSVFIFTVIRTCGFFPG